MFKYLLDLIGDHTPTKAACSTALGFALGSAGLTEWDLRLSVVLKIMGIIAFLVTIFIAIPKITELLSKFVKAIRTTFHD